MRPQSRLRAALLTVSATTAAVALACLPVSADETEPPAEPIPTEATAPPTTAVVSTDAASPETTDTPTTTGAPETTVAAEPAPETTGATTAADVTEPATTAGTSEGDQAGSEGGETGDPAEAVAPVAVDDAITIYANHSATVDVLANDTVPAGSTVLLWNGTQAVSSIINIYGTWSIDGSTVVHTPPDGRAGPRSIQYVVTAPDGQQAIATVSVQVNSISRPVMIGDRATVDLNEAVTIDVLANDFGGSNRDGERYPLQPDTLRLEPPDGSEVTSYTDETGTWTAADGVVHYEPAQDYWGSVTVHYLVNDSVRQQGRGSINVTVRATPDAVDDTATTVQGEAVTVAVTDNDTTPPNTSFDLIGLVGPAGNRVGTVEQDGIGTWTYSGFDVTFTPAAGFVGEATVSYRLVNDRYSSDDATVTVTVTSALDAVDDAVTIWANHSATVDVLANDSAPAGSTVQLWDGTQPVSSIINLYGTWSVDGTDVVHTPPDGHAGPRTIQYVVIAPDGTQDVATVRVQVNSISKPVLLGNSASTLLNTPITIDVLANDFGGSNRDGERYPLQPDTLRLVPPDGSEVTSYTDETGTWTAADGVVHYEPAPDFWGNVSLDYRVSDSVRQRGTGWISLTVRPTPDAVDDIATTVQGEAVTVAVTDNDTTPPNTSFDLIGLVGATGNRVGSVEQDGVGTWTYSRFDVTFTPAAGFVGEATVSYRLINDRYNSDDAVVTVIVEAAVVEANDDRVEIVFWRTARIDVLANDTATGAPIDPATLRLVAPDGSRVTAYRTWQGRWSIVDGQVRFTPRLLAFGTHSATYVIGNGLTTDTATVSVRVTPLPNWPFDWPF